MISIVDYRAGNLRSVARACREVGANAELVAEPERIATSERIIFPGVGTAESGMRTLRKTGLDEALTAAFARGTPILGICLGAQIILDHSEEGNEKCLGLVTGQCRRFSPEDPELKVPHIGWNQVVVRQTHPLLDGFPDGAEFYFVNSYYPDPEDTNCVYGESEYGHPFCAMLGRGNLFATQFHLEKSGRWGLDLLRRFTLWDG